MANIFDIFRERKAWLDDLAAKRRAKRAARARIAIKSRVDEVLDPPGGRRLFDDLTPDDPLDFPGYAEKVADLAKRSGYHDAVLCKVGSIEGNEVVCVELLPEFLMGSMGVVVGETVTRAAEHAAECRLPLVIFSASGGARMQEGMFSLMQMAKTSAAIRRLHERGILYISVLTHPTTGGVTASFASLGDVILAEPQALIGFAGPRVIEQTIGAKLPEGFQSAEFQLAHGFVDAVVEREHMRETLARLLRLHREEDDGGGDAHNAPKYACDNSPPSAPPAPSAAAPSAAAPSAAAPRTSSAAPALTPHEEVACARRGDRPHVRDFIDGLFTDFFETRGDRLYRDDPALICGIARLEGMPVTVAGHVKGTDITKNIACNFGMPHPEGYRKFQRALAQAVTFGRPVITFIDTPGAYPGAEAEERGQGEAIARCLYELSSVPVPVVVVVTGEGGSGGALALAVGDQVLMFEHAVFSVLSPEGFASILWKDSQRAKEAAEVMKLTAGDLLASHMVDTLLPEPEGSAAADHAAAIASLKPHLLQALTRLRALDTSELLARRHQRYRRF
jgi:acetyl-CoA carboxylase carboxyl transferase subunit beta